jgi:NAD(P) transhydrogenase
MNHYDVVILGGGPGGERAAIQAARIGKRVALIEREHVVGGTCINWGTIPSKTLRESAVFVLGLTTHKIEGIRCDIAERITMADFMHHERIVVQRELEIINRTLERHAIEVIEGHGRFLDPHTIGVTGRDGRERLRVEGDIIVIATGSRPNRPPDIRFDGETVFDSASILRLNRVPESMVVLGAGVIGVEYASIFASLGIEVTLVDTREQLLPYLDREMAGLLARSLRKLRIVLVQGDHYQKIEAVAGPRQTVRCHTRKGNVLEADSLLYCVGRDGNTDNIGLETIGIRPNDRGLLEVNEFYQTTHPHIYAVGDVTGYPALASTSAEQGRQAIRHAFNVPGPRGRTEMLPFAIYAIPEFSFVGENEEELQRKGVDYVAGHGQYEMNPRGQILADTDGVLKILCETESLRLRGVHILGTSASELVHIGQAYLQNKADAWQMAEAMYNYPTLSDLYRHAALKAIAARRRRKELGEVAAKRVLQDLPYARYEPPEYENPDG